LFLFLINIVMNKHFYLIVGFLINISITSAQTGSSWLNYTFSEKVVDIKVHKDNVWVATLGGLVEYNKTTGKKNYYTKASHGLPSNHIASIEFDHDENLWMSTKYNGIGKFNINANNCIVYNQANSGLPFDQWNYKIIVDKNNNIWVACQRWLACLKGDIWQSWEIGSPISSSFSIRDLLIDSTGRVWVCSTIGIGTFENGSYKQIPEITGTVYCIALDKNKNLWFGTANNGLYSYNGKTFTNYNTSNSSLTSNTIFALKFDTQNNLWLASNGLIKFNGSVFTLFPTPSSNLLLSIQPDKNDTIWCGTFDGVLLCFNGSKFTSISVSNSPLKSNYISDIACDNNSVWIGTQSNLVKSNNFNLSSVSKSDTAFIPSYVTSIISDKNGNIWVAFGTGDTTILKISKESTFVLNASNSPFCKDAAIINNMVVDNNNNLWIASNNGLYKYDGVTFLNYNKSNSSLPSNNIFSLTCDHLNNIWGGTPSGFFKYSNSTWLIWNTSNSSLPTNTISSIACDSEDKIWLSCMDDNRYIGKEFGGGLVCFDGSKMDIYNISNSNIQSNTIFNIFIDSSDAVWLGTCGAGLVSFKNKSVWKSYEMSNSGIAFNDVQRVYKDKSGNIWLGHINAGVSVFNPDSFILSANKINENRTTFKIFPNPAYNDLYINFKSINEKKIQAKIFDLNGRLIHVFSAQSIDTGFQTLHYSLGGFLSLNQLYIFNVTSYNNQYNAKFLFLKK
jgi:ligand-binding sensor domain-containing protein